MIYNIKIINTEILSDNWYVLKKITYSYSKKDGTVKTQVREAYDRGNGATILLFNKDRKTVILTRQFRLPTFINGNESGMMIESCAGLLDENNPEDCIIKETEEETGYRVKDVHRIFDVYMSPGAVTERVYFFIAEYSEAMKVTNGGGAENEEENIDVLEMDIDNALKMVDNGEIKDGKTIILLQYIKLHNLI
jgi:nudix-type nucleoside diphosphatase, YffH/AdpP family